MLESDDTYDETRGMSENNTATATTADSSAETKEPSMASESESSDDNGQDGEHVTAEGEDGPIPKWRLLLMVGV